MIQPPPLLPFLIMGVIVVVGSSVLLGIMANSWVITVSIIVGITALIAGMLFVAYLLDKRVEKKSRNIETETLV